MMESILMWLIANPEVAIGAASVFGASVYYAVNAYKKTAQIMSEAIEIREPKGVIHKPVKTILADTLSDTRDPLVKLLMSNLAKRAEKRNSDSN